jgi:putative ABC transport system substrate-binding protein
VTTRRAFLGALTGVLLPAPLAAYAQQSTKMSRIGFLASGASAGTAPRLETFRQGLRDLGYVEGRNIAIEYRWAEGKVERLPAFASELSGLKVLAASSPW